MSGNKILLDSNVIIAALDGHDVALELMDKKTLLVSFISELEVQSHQKLTPPELKIIRSFLNECIIIDPDQEIKKLAIDFRVKYKLKLPDAIIAATAYHFDLPLITADKAFGKIQEIELIRFSI